MDRSAFRARPRGRKGETSGGLLAQVALMLGNFVIGVGVLAPAGCSTSSPRGST
jgi:hypothetical protein